MFMGILFNVFLKTLGFFLAILLFFLIILGISAYTNYQDGIEFDLIRGKIDSSNTIFILEINGQFKWAEVYWSSGHSYAFFAEDLEVINETR